VPAKYSTATDQQPGKYQVKLGDQTIDCPVKPIRNAKDIRTLKPGTVNFPAGETEILFQPSEMATGDTTQLFEIDLEPVGS
jgi:hypothetical protein